MSVLQLGSREAEFVGEGEVAGQAQRAGVGGAVKGLPRQDVGHQELSFVTHWFWLLWSKNSS